MSVPDLRSDGTPEITVEARELLAAQQARLPQAEVTAQRNAAAVRGSNRTMERLLERAAGTPRRTKRTRLILEAASEWAAPVSRQAACRRGCAHCCHIPVVITLAEAEVLAKATGRTLTVPANARPIHELDLQAKAGPAGPCPFLREGQCTAYEARPVVCRTHLNMDADDLLCQLVPGQTTPVPYADKRLILGIAMKLMEGEPLADIREFFPT